MFKYVGIFPPKKYWSIISVNAVEMNELKEGRRMKVY